MFTDMVPFEIFLFEGITRAYISMGALDMAEVALNKGLSMEPDTKHHNIRLPHTNPIITLKATVITPGSRKG